MHSECLFATRDRPAPVATQGDRNEVLHPASATPRALPVPVRVLRESVKDRVRPCSSVSPCVPEPLSRVVWLPLGDRSTVKS